MIWTFINGWQKTSYRRVSGVLIMMLISLSSGSTGHASEELPSMELLELLGQFDQQDAAWINNELGIEDSPDIEIKNDLQKLDKQNSSEYINE